MTQFTNLFSEEVWRTKYRYGDEKTIDNTFRRVAKAIAFVEDIQIRAYWEEKFFQVLSDFKFVPGGRILSNAGTGISGTTLLNCFVSGIEGEDQDSMEGIMSELRRQALILKSEGGYGTSFDVLRPRGSFVSGIANETPGSVAMMELWDKQSEIITQGSGKVSKNPNAKEVIRKGAQLGKLSVWHPDIEEFITAKQTPGRLNKFNLSVGITDAFMLAVKEHKPWSLIFPDYTDKARYKKEWNGDIEVWLKKGYPVITYKEYSDANILWDLIVRSTYDKNEPGILFMDTINKMNNLHYCEHIFSTNPCGEQPLGIGSVCLLGNINLTQYVSNDIWDYRKLKEDIPVMIRFMDNVNDIANPPLPEQQESLENKRRIGLGIMGYASGLLMKGERYGSVESIENTEELMSFIANIAYQSSAQLAYEKGSFLFYNQEQYGKSLFLKVLNLTTTDLITKYGMRNSHLLCIAPTGNTSALANNVSGGLEPLFATNFHRTYIIGEAPEGLVLPKKVDWVNATADANDWVWIKEGEDNLLSITFKDSVYKYDKNRGLTKVVNIIDYGYNNKKDIANIVVTSNELSIDEHINTLKVFAKYVDAAASKTINVPNNYSFEDFKNVYTKVYESGIKGCTTYRDGTMMNVLSTTIQTLVQKNNALKRPKKLPCDIHHLTVGGHKWIVLIGVLNNQPYEVFAFKNKDINLSPVITTGFLTKVKSGCYNLDLGLLNLENITNLFTQDEEEALTRMISLALRHNVDIKHIKDQLNKAEGTIVSFSKAISRTLSKYIKEEVTKELCPECNSPLIKVEACTKCSNCDYSVC